MALPVVLLSSRDIVFTVGPVVSVGCPIETSVVITRSDGLPIIKLLQNHIVPTLIFHRHTKFIRLNLESKFNDEAACEFSKGQRCLCGERRLRKFDQNDRSLVICSNSVGKHTLKKKHPELFTVTDAYTQRTNCRYQHALYSYSL